MPRPLSYRDDSRDRARAGAVTLTRMEDNAVEERRYQDQLARQTKQDERAESREQRMDESTNLENEMRKYDFEKKKAFDANAARMKIENDKQAIAANEELFKINTETPDAPLKLAEWGAKYFRVLDGETGDPRLIQQFQINQTRAEAARTYRQKLEDERAKDAQEKAAAEAKAAELKANADATRAQVMDLGLVASGASVGDDGKLRTTYVSPKSQDSGSYTEFNKELEAMVKSYGGAANVPAEKWAQFEERKKAIGGGPAAPTPANDPQKSAALRWAEANPSDPRSAAIKKKLGL